MEKCFPPVVDKKTEVLILGSFPGKESLRKQEYYGHKMNLFWKILGLVLNENLVESTYTQKKKKLLKHKVGLWDVFGSCERESSLDSHIKNPKANDFLALLRLAPKIRLVCFNGQKAGKFAKMTEEAGLRSVVLPSTSPANASISFEKKLKAWKKIITS